LQQPTPSPGEYEVSDKALLKISGLHAYVEQFYILQGVTLEVPSQGAVVLLGRNGAGKTTKCSGEIIFFGEDIKGLPPYEIARRKITLVPEDQGIFALLNVGENILVSQRQSSSRGELARRLDFTLSLFPDLKLAWNRKAGTLSGGQKQMLAMARALANENHLIMLDEPSKGLAPLLVKGLGNVIRQIQAHSAVLLVEQNFAFASTLGDTFSILSDGKTVLSGKMSELLENSETQQRFLGVSANEGLRR
jgi:branched-chain amino acid transport system ATP-binding protein